jgi:hypothetical protein
MLNRAITLVAEALVAVLSACPWIRTIILTSSSSGSLYSPPNKTTPISLLFLHAIESRQNWCTPITTDYEKEDELSVATSSVCLNVLNGAIMVPLPAVSLPYMETYTVSCALITGQSSANLNGAFFSLAWKEHGKKREVQCLAPKTLAIRCVNSWHGSDAFQQHWPQPRAILVLESYHVISRPRRTVQSPVIQFRAVVDSISQILVETEAVAEPAWKKWFGFFRVSL